MGKWIMVIVIGLTFLIMFNIKHKEIKETETLIQSPEHIEAKEYLGWKKEDSPSMIEALDRMALKIKELENNKENH